MAAILLLADATSKVPFFILGGALALWAVVLSWFGLSRPDFPANAGGERGVIGLTVVMAALAIGAAILTA
ncbi:MAG TPA: hypothetical protein VFN87_00495 [Solirubrobacteraceae bacterium]|nr:hypothetical protein [Solirubrobacteraceae bacterium]